MNKGFLFEGGDGDVRGTTATSPWEFSGYTGAVELEHHQRRTTSIDYKIGQLRKQKPRLDHSEIPQENNHPKAKPKSKKKQKEKLKGGKAGTNGCDENVDGTAPIAPEDGEEDGDGNLDQAPRKKDENERSIEVDREIKKQSKDNKKTKSDIERSKHSARRPVVSIEEKLVGDGKEASKGFFSAANGASFTAKSFIDLNISRPLIHACETLGYDRPTPIQAACIPLALTGRDICGSAVTGSGKTAAFALPLLERLLFRPRRIPAIRVLILTPTRELAVQIHSMIEKLAQYTDIKCCLVVGGLSNKVQEVALRSHPDIVIATPGRMIDHLQNSQSVGLEELAILVLDEADRLLQLGFRQELHELVRLCPKRRQTMLFSATMTEEVAELIQLSLNFPVRLSADPSTQRPSTLSEEVIKLRPSQEADKEAMLLAICSRSFSSRAIIFSGTKMEAHRLKILFGLSHLKAGELHGNLTQTQRLDALESFRKQEVNFLIATDVAARGLDIIGVETVINFECPRDITIYVHRVGRTARAGRQGCAVTFVSEKDRPLLKAMAKRAGKKLLSRKVSQMATEKWRKEIENMEGDVQAILQEERKERMLRKAEMEANKAQNIIEHEAEIYSRPKKTWFQSEKEKKMVKSIQKDAEKGTDKNISFNEFEKLQKNKKRELEKEKYLPRKKRRQLEAARETESNNVTLEDPEHQDAQKAPNNVNSIRRTSTVEAAYRRAKAVKAADRAREAGRFFKINIGAKKEKKKVVVSRKEEMEQLFRGDVKDTKKRRSINPFNKKKAGSQKGFKSKARYKRRK